MRSIILAGTAGIVPTPAERRHGAAQPFGSPGVKPAATMAIFIACSWNSGTPLVLPSTSRSSSAPSVRVRGRAG
jgi:hypothetical protein